jgi:hypothetical protein
MLFHKRVTFTLGLLGPLNRVALSGWGEVRASPAAPVFEAGTPVEKHLVRERHLKLLYPPNIVHGGPQRNAAPGLAGPFTPILAKLFGTTLG